MLIKANTDIFVLRFSDKNNIDTIKEHKEILNQKGYVWYGKMGITPLKSYFDTHLKDSSTLVLLTQPSKYYTAECVEYSLERPIKVDYPSYYDTVQFSGFNFTSWYKIVSITEVSNKDVLENIVIKSSGNFLRSALQGSMSPMFKAKTIKEIEFEEKRES